ncbi:MAG: segregation/condensation protein A [Nitrospirae bacterium]|nr:segregation/condensation protein A [Nitrospirota bacterium]
MSEDILQAEEQENFLFKMPDFEGPLDLLLHMIREEKIDIYDIPIVHITKQYLEYIDLMKELNLEIAGEFLVMAATLIHIKTKMLLPPDEVAADEAPEDPRSELVMRLLEYQAFKDSSLYLRTREETWKNVFHRPLPQKEDFDFEPEPLFDEMSVFDLISAFKELLKTAPMEMREITRETLTISDKINFIVERLEKEDGIRFQDLFEGDYTKVSIIVTFLALLEISRLGLARIYQEKGFGIIWIINPDKMGAAPAVEISTSSETSQ